MIEKLDSSDGWRGECVGVGGGGTLRMTSEYHDDNSDGQRSYGFDSVLMVRVRNSRIVYRKENT